MSVELFIPTTDNGAKTNYSSGSADLNLFFVAGASRAMSAEEIVSLFQAAYDQDKEMALRILLWARDCRGGAGERRFFNVIASYLLSQSHEWGQFLADASLKFGSWKDVFSLTPTPDLVAFTASHLSTDNLCAKWMPRKGAWFEAVRKYMSWTPKQLRKHLVSNSNTVEQKMCSKDWMEIDYKTVPSVAMSRYKNAFRSRDPFRYGQYIERVLEGKEKINASSVFPHDVVRNVNDAEATQAQWDALPDYLEGNSSRILPLCDVSGSMDRAVSGSVTAMDVCIALGIYLAQRMEGPLKNRIMTFTDIPSIMSIGGENIVHDIHQVRRMPWGMNTNLTRAFESLLGDAIAYELQPDQMPEKIVIFSDMEFDEATRGETNYEYIKRIYNEAGYTPPQIVFWNLLGRAGNVPVTMHDENTALVSGFSPAIMSSVLKGDVDPMSIMIDAVCVPRYNMASRM